MSALSILHTLRASRIYTIYKNSLSLCVVVLLAFNSISFARPLSKDTLRQESTALHIAKNIKNTLTPEITTPFSTASLNGIEIAVRKVPEIFAELDNEEQEAILSVLGINLSSAHYYDGLTAAMKLLFLATAEEDTITPYKYELSDFIQKIFNSATNNSGYVGKEDKLLLAFGLTMLGFINRNILNEEYADNICSEFKAVYNRTCRFERDAFKALIQEDYGKVLSRIGIIAIKRLGLTPEETIGPKYSFTNCKDSLEFMEEELESDYLFDKLLPAVVIAGLAGIKDKIFKKHKDYILELFKEGLTSNDNYENFMGIIGLIALGRKTRPLYRFEIKHPGLEKPVIILTRDKKDFKKQLEAEDIDGGLKRRLCNKKFAEAVFTLASAETGVSFITFTPCSVSVLKTSNIISSIKQSA